MYTYINRPLDEIRRRQNEQYERDAAKSDEYDRIIDEINKDLLVQRKPRSVSSEHDSDEDYHCADDYDDSTTGYIRETDPRYKLNLELFERTIKEDQDEYDDINHVSKKKNESTPMAFNLEDILGDPSGDLGSYELDLGSLYINEQTDYCDEEYDSDEYFQDITEFPVVQIEADVEVDAKPLHSSLYVRKIKKTDDFKFHYRKKLKTVKKKKSSELHEQTVPIDLNELIKSISCDLIHSSKDDEEFLLKKLHRFLLRGDILGRLSRNKRRARNSETVLILLRIRILQKSISKDFLIFKLRINEFYIFRLIVHHCNPNSMSIKKLFKDMMESLVLSD